MDLVYIMESVPVIGPRVFVLGHVVGLLRERWIGLLCKFSRLLVLPVYKIELIDVFFQERNSFLQFLVTMIRVLCRGQRVNENSPDTAVNVLTWRTPSSSERTPWEL